MFHGANIDLPCKLTGNTILHTAVQNEDLEAVIFLLEHCRANPNIANFEGYTPLDYTKPDILNR